MQETLQVLLLLMQSRLDPAASASAAAAPAAMMQQQRLQTMNQMQQQRQSLRLRMVKQQGLLGCAVTAALTLTQGPNRAGSRTSSRASSCWCMQTE
jgi:hypothetical protein